MVELSDYSEEKRGVADAMMYVNAAYVLLEKYSETKDEHYLFTAARNCQKAVSIVSGQPVPYVLTERGKNEIADKRNT